MRRKRDSRARIDENLCREMGGAAQLSLNMVLMDFGEFLGENSILHYQRLIANEAKKG